MEDLNKVDLDDNTVQKECVGCGRIFLVFKEMADVSQYCSKTCSEAHSIFNISN